MATAVASKKQIGRLTGKHFINWLQAQGSETVVGYIGDHVQYPIELWLSDVLNCKMTVSSVDDFEYNGKQYRLSQAFSDFSICVQEGDLDELPECGWREVTAAEMLEQVAQYISASDMLVEKPAKQVQEVTIIARYAHKTNGKPNGNVSYLVENGGGKQYCITIASNGNTACTIYQPEKKLDIPESCPSCNGSRKCYHIKACQKQEEARGWQIPAGKSLVRDDYRSDEREAVLATARKNSESELAKIEDETMAVIEAEEAAESVGKSEQARLADLPFSDDEKRYSRWTEQEMLAAPLNGSRAFSLMRR